MVGSGGSKPAYLAIAEPRSAMVAPGLLYMYRLMTFMQLVIINHYCSCYALMVLYVNCNTRNTKIRKVRYRIEINFLPSLMLERDVSFITWPEMF